MSDSIWVKGGKHYQSFKIQPSQFINSNHLEFAEGNVIKYVCRYSWYAKVIDESVA